MSLEEGIHLVDELAEMKVPILIFTGGEPLLSRNFYALAFHAREVGLRTVISTNGTLITPEVARLLAEAQIRYVGVSLDSATARSGTTPSGAWLERMPGPCRASRTPATPA